MRLAGDPAVYKALAGSDVPESVQRAQVDSRLDAFFDLYALLQSKGYSDAAAQQTAMDMMAGAQPMAQPTKRFAGVYGRTS